MSIFRDGSRIPEEIAAAQAGLDAIGMHALGRELNPDADDTPREPLTKIQILHLGEVLTLPVTVLGESEPKV